MIVITPERRALWMAWLVLFAGAWVPFLAVGAAYLGWTLRRVSGVQASAMMVLGPLVGAAGVATYFV